MAVEAGPRTFATPAAMQAQADGWRASALSIGLVPTMGALHRGHLSLVGRATAENDRTVVSIFVNPLQFGPGEDFEAYPRTPERDLAQLAELGVDAVYLPSQDQMYPATATTRIRVGPLGEPLEGAHRPGHFEGVATVVAKLFNASRPQRAYFGQKDAQQAAVIARLAADLDTGVEVIVCPTVREADGLALSSRNAYLDLAERSAAVVVFRALKAADTEYLAGQRDAGRLQELMQRTLAGEPRARVDYAAVVDPVDFRPPSGPDRALLAVLAVRIGRTRLIDNHPLGKAI